MAVHALRGREHPVTVTRQAFGSLVRTYSRTAVDAAGNRGGRPCARARWHWARTNLPYAAHGCVSTHLGQLLRKLERALRVARHDVLEERAVVGLVPDLQRASYGERNVWHAN